MRPPGQAALNIPAPMIPLLFGLVLVVVLVTLVALRVEQSRQDQADLGPVRNNVLQVCASCGKVRDGSGSWQAVESDPRQLPGVICSHGICPECVRKLYPDLADRVLDEPP